MKYLIFGGTGFVGKSLVQYLEQQGQEVLSVSRSGRGKSLALDITKESDFLKLNYLPDIIINCASKIPEKGKSSSDPLFIRELFLTNVVGAVNITNWAVKNNIPKILNCSTLVVVKKPWPNPLKEEFSNLPDGLHVGYSMSKLSQERIMDECVKPSKTKLVHIRLSAVYGEGMTRDGVIFNLIDNLKSNKEVILHDSFRNSADFIHVRDVCKSLFNLSKQEISWDYLNLASGKPVTINELALQLKKILNSKSKIIDKESNRPSSEAHIDISRLRKIIGGTYSDFLPLEEGLATLIEGEDKFNN